MLCEIAEIVARTDPVRALQISEDLDAVTQSEVLVSIVTVLVLTDIEYALQIARRIPDQHSRAMALGTIASTTERPELADEALEVARGRLDDPDERAEALGAIVIVVATTMTDLAVEIARSFEEPADRVSALLEVMAQVGQPDVVDELLEDRGTSKSRLNGSPGCCRSHPSSGDPISPTRPSRSPAASTTATNGRSRSARSSPRRPPRPQTSPSRSPAVSRTNRCERGRCWRSHQRASGPN